MQDLGLRVAVECGVYYGISTEYMILSSDDSFVIGIDWELRLETIGPIYERHPKNVIFLNHNTTDAGDKVFELLDGKTIDLLFLDSTHDGATPTKEFEQYKPMFSDVALVVCDDIGGLLMQDFWQNLPGEKVELNDLHLSYGASVGFGASIVRK
jgi:predicted O-methyltransferase YrrM